MNQNHQPFPRVPVRGEPPTRCPTCGGSTIVTLALVTYAAAVFSLIGDAEKAGAL